MDPDREDPSAIDGIVARLAVSADDLRAAQRLARVGSWTWDPVADIPVWSDELCRIYGLTPGERILPYAEASVLYTPESWQRLSAAAEACATAGVSYSVDITIVWPDGSLHEANSRGEAVRDATGAIVGVRGTVADISERRHAEDRFRRLLHNSPLNGVIYRFVRDETGSIVDLVIEDLNDLAADALGGPTADLIGRSAIDLMGDALLPYLEIARDVDRTGEPRTFELHFDWNGRDYLAVDFLVGDDRYANLNLDITDLKRAERAAQASERRYAELVERLPVGVYTCRQDPTGSVTYTFVSEQMGRIVGVEPALLIADSANSALTCHAEDLAGFVQSMIDAVVHPDEPYHWEGRFVVEDQVRWVRVQAEATPVGDGSWTWHGVVEDVTARHRAEDALREREERYRLLAESVSDQVVALDRDLRYTYWNREAERATGIPAEAALGRTPKELFGALADDTVVRGVERVLATGEAMTVLQDLATGDDTRTHEVALYPFRDGVTVLSRDVTERTRAESAMRASADLYRGVVESVADGVIVHGADSRTVAMNARAETMLGVDLDGLAERPFDDPRWDLAREDGTPFPIEEHPALLTLRTGRPAADAVMVLARPDGTRVVLSVRAEPLLGPDGVASGAVVSFADVTEIRQIERGLREAQKLEAIGRLAGGIAHDFNNLLTAIAGSAEMLSDAIPPDDPRRVDVDEIRRSSSRAAALTRQLLAFGRRQVLRPSDLSVDEAVADLEPMLERTLGEHIEVRVVTPPAPCRARVDRVQLEQVILNLALNARDAMPAGGTLTLETSFADDPMDRGRPVAGLSEDAPWVRLAVSDTGVGMDAETISHIFEPFYSTKAADRGTGLGLATVHGIVAQSGGSIEVASEPGHGTTFTVLLPRAHDRLGDPVPVGLEREALLGGARHHGDVTVLLAEDDAAVRIFTRRVLRERGYRVLESSSGDEALRIADAFPDRIDILVTDVLMPGLSGPDLARELTQERPGVRTLFVSGFTPESVLPAGVRGEMTFLSKPFSRADLLERVASLAEPRDGASD